MQLDDHTIEDIKARCDLLALIGRDTTLRKVSGGNGGEYAGPCPFCGGDDRFRVQPAQRRWWCRGCSPSKRWGDCFAYIMQRNSLTFPEAAEELAGGAVLRSEPLPPPPPEPPAMPREAQWQRDAEALLYHAHAELLDSPDVLAYLHSERGIDRATVLAWRLGYLAVNSSDLGDWTGHGRKPEIWLPAGLTIPVYDASGVLWTAKVRLGKAARWPCGRCDAFVEGATCPTCGRARMKYWKAARTPATLFGLANTRHHSAAVLCEGELDAALLWQEAGDLVDVYSGVTGVSSWQTEWDLHLLRYRRVLVAYDNDEEGNRWARTRIDVMPRLTRMTPPAGKDITDYWRCGGDLRQWVAERLRKGY